LPQFRQRRYAPFDQLLITLDPGIGERVGMCERAAAVQLAPELLSKLALCPVRVVGFLYPAQRGHDALLRRRNS
jgi:hypothetical protein